MMSASARARLASESPNRPPRSRAKQAVVDRIDDDLDLDRLASACTPKPNTLRRSTARWCRTSQVTESRSPCFVRQPRSSRLGPPDGRAARRRLGRRSRSRPIHWFGRTGRRGGSVTIVHAAGLVVADGVQVERRCRCWTEPAAWPGRGTVPRGWDQLERRTEDGAPRPGAGGAGRFWSQSTLEVGTG